MPERPEAKAIAEAVKTSFEKFKADKEAMKIMSWKDLWRNEGKAKVRSKV